MNPIVITILTGIIVVALQIGHQEKHISVSVIYWAAGFAALFLFAYSIDLFSYRSIGTEGFTRFCRENRLAEVYRNLLKSALDRLDRWLCPPEYLDQSSPDLVQPPHPKRAWNWRAYDWMLLLAVAYPLGLPLFIWMLTGAPTELGAIPLIKTPDHGWSIPLAWATLAVLIFHRKIARKLHTTVIWPAVNLLLRAILARPAQLN
ncbi:hypothetical protein K4F85_02930 [Phaeobacter inhibens]|uniref:hypothetical protein n=1 Tax=Phaeobacter inhibens TaxID=221822 RepID=UPI0021A6BBB4|nr:hypothetical protein [Phaeobacter inhibens]UWR41874.1 hypothetical protein K4F85_02930 [Phaeobacter inhibens]